MGDDIERDFLSSGLGENFDLQLDYTRSEGDTVHTRFPPGSTHIFTADEQVLRTA